MEFPVLFLRRTCDNIRALYSLMNYADIALGTGTAKGRHMHEIIKGMVKLAAKRGVQINTHDWSWGQKKRKGKKTIRRKKKKKKKKIENGTRHSVRLKSGERMQSNIVVAERIYHHVDRHLINPKSSNYSWGILGYSASWPPSKLIYFIWE